MATDEWKQAHPLAHKKSNKRRGPGGGSQEPTLSWLETVDKLYSPSDRPDWVAGQLLTCVRDDPMSKLEYSDGAFFEYWSNVHYSECIVTVDKVLMAKRNPNGERNYHEL
jgi:hypothetical protein